MSKKEFVPFLDHQLEVLSQSNKWQLRHKKILKKDDSLQHAFVRKYVPQDMDSDEVNIYLLEEGGEVHGIQFNCKCGARATIHLE